MSTMGSKAGTMNKPKPKKIKRHFFSFKLLNKLHVVAVKAHTRKTEFLFELCLHAHTI